jgi:hypothetical protein
VDDFNRDRDAATPSPVAGRPGYAEYLALGAVIAGSVGAIVGAARCRQSHARAARFDGDRPESSMVTAPHGDKLSSAF